MFKIYRLEEKARILAALKANGSILLCGDEGSGKTVLMDSVREELTADGYALAAILAPATQRQMLISICEQLTIDTIELEGKALTVEKLRWAVSDYIRSNPATFLVFDDAHQLDPKFRTWLKNIQRQGCSLLLAATKPPRTDIFLNTPPLILRPLPDYFIRDLMEAAAVLRGLNLSQSQLADLQQRAGGNPALAIRSIDEEYLGLEVEAGDRGDYFDITPLLILAATGFVMLRFFAIGTDSRLLYVIAGMGGALLIGITYMLRTLPKDSKKLVSNRDRILMMTLTHLAISGLMTGLVLGTADPMLISSGAIAGLLPDVDLSKSPAGRVLFPISRLLEKRFPHRSCTHSILASVAIASLVYGLAYSSVISWKLAHAIEIGYTFGYLVDAITKSGIQLFFPANLRCVVPGNRNLRLSTGSNWEYAILVLVVAVFMLVLNINTNGGMSASFNEILATPRGVQELLNKKGSTHQIIVSIDGVRTFDRARIKDEYVVVEQRDANTFLVHPLSTPDELYQVSNRPDLEHQIVSERITGKVGRKVVTTIESMAWADEEVTPKLDKLLDRFPDAQMYLTGSIEIDDPDEMTIRTDPQQLTTVTKQGRKLAFNSCPMTNAIGLLRDQWGSGQVRIRVIVKN